MPTIAPSPADLVAILKQAWRGGAPPDVRGALRDHPELLRHRHLVVELAYEEYCLRELAGQTPATESFCRDLPAHFRSEVREVIRGHRTMCDHPELFDRTECRWPEPGEAFAGFTVVGELGRGAFARAYLAADPDTGDRPVVLKLSPTASGEARTLGPVRHPHVADVLWARTVDGVSALCLRYVGAATLQDVIAVAFDAPDGPPTARTVLAVIDAAGSGLPPPEPVPALLDGRGSYQDAVAAIGARLAGALAVLHARGVTHGDLKPSNVVLGPGGHPYLIDFNLSQDVKESLHRVVGTLPYMPPERVRRLLGEKADPGPADRADVYAFGAVLYEALTGRVPYEPLDSPDLDAVRADQLRRQLASDPPTVPGRLGRLVRDCLAADPARRPTAATVRRRLDQYVGRRTRWARLAAVGVMIAAGVSLAIWDATRPTQVPSPPVVVAPRTADEFIARGFEFLGRDDATGAIADFSRAFDLHPDGRTAALIGYACSKGGRHPESIAFYTKAIDQFGYGPAWVRNNRAYGMIQYGLNDPARLERGAEEARVALDLDQSLLAARYNWAKARFLARLDRGTRRLNDRLVLAAIEQDLTAVLEIHRDNIRLHKLMAEVLAAPEWADADRLRRARGHLDAAKSLGQASKAVSPKPDSIRPSNQVDPGLADPPT